MGEAKPQQLVWSLSVVEVTEDGAILLCPVVSTPLNHRIGAGSGAIKKATGTGDLWLMKAYFGE